MRICREVSETKTAHEINTHKRVYSQTQQGGTYPSTCTNRHAHIVALPLLVQEYRCIHKYTQGAFQKHTHMYKYMHTKVHTSHTYIHRSIHHNIKPTCMQIYIHSHMYASSQHTSITTCMHSFIQTHIHHNTHAHKHTNMHACKLTFITTCIPHTTNI